MEGGRPHFFFRRSSMTSPHAAALLGALAYPHPAADFGDGQALQALVAWLEHTKVSE